MSNRTPAAIAAIVTVLLLMLLAAASVLVQMLALNGVSESQGLTAMGISLACQAATTILAAILAARLADLTIRKFQWHRALAIVAAVLAGLALGVAGLLASLLLALPLAGIG